MEFLSYLALISLLICYLSLENTLLAPIFDTRMTVEKIAGSCQYFLLHLCTQVFLFLLSSLGKILLIQYMYFSKIMTAYSKGTSLKGKLFFDFQKI